MQKACEKYRSIKNTVYGIVTLIARAPTYGAPLFIPEYQV